jgi:hypothetical protein
MAEPLLCACPECDKTLKVPAEMAGKKVRCKSCGATFVAKGSKAAVTKAAPAKDKDKARPKPKPKPRDEDEDDAPIPVREEKKPSLDEDEEDSNPYGVTEEYLGPRCPECANAMEEGDIVCLQCGYNTQSRERARTRKVHDTTGVDYFLWWLPGIACVLTIIFLILWDVLYCIYIADWVEYDAADSPWYSFIAHFAIKLWMVIISLFFMFYAGKYAVKRLILNYEPPEVEKH